MELFANDQSIHKQFYDSNSFCAALSRVMKMRRIADQYGVKLYCHRTLINTSPAPGKSLQQAIASLPSKNQIRAVMSWLTKNGPFWDDLGERHHSGEDYLECNGSIVTDSAVGEVGFRKIHGIDCGLVSFSPSDWRFSPVPIVWRRDAEGIVSKEVEVNNWWTLDQFESDLNRMPVSISSWTDVFRTSVSRFKHLRISETSFLSLDGLPFACSSADRILVLLGILDQLASQYDENGIRTHAGHHLYSDYFVGDRAWFSDSSESEKRDFREQLTFAHPEDPEKKLFCPWHGKESHSVLRIHFPGPNKPAVQFMLFMQVLKSQNDEVF